MRKKLIITIMLLILTGCSQEKQENDITHLDWFVNFSWFSAPWGENNVTKEITDKTDVNISFSVPAGDEDETINNILNSDRLPDLITLGWWQPQVNTLIENDLVYSLNELADKYSPEFYDYANKDTIFWYTQDDGNLYCYPSASVPPETYKNGAVTPSNAVFVVRKDLYEALGCPDMTTPEGFANTLRLAKEKFPEVNGYPLIPIGVDEFNNYGGGSFNERLRDLLAIPHEKNGYAWDYTTDPEYITWLKTFRELVNDGTISADLFLDKRQQVSEKLLRGQYFCLLYQWSDLENEQIKLFHNNPDSSYIAVDAIRNSNGDNPTLSGVGINGWTVTFISKDCENPEKAIELMTYLMSEQGQKLTLLGIENKDYTVENNKIKINEENKELLKNNPSEYIAKIGGNNTYWFFENDIIQSEFNIEPDESLKQMQNLALNYTVDVSPYEIVFPLNSEYAIINDKIKTLWGETLPRLLMAETENEFDILLNDYIKKRDELGFDILQQEKTRLYQINKSKLEELKNEK